MHFGLPFASHKVCVLLWNSVPLLHCCGVVYLCALGELLAHQSVIFVKATAAAELNCLVTAEFLFEWRLCREGLLARKLGQLLSVKDCVWRVDPGCGFILKLLVWHAQTQTYTHTHTHTHTHTQSLPRILCTPLFSAHSLRLWISGCYFIAYTREREKDLERGREIVSDWGDMWGRETGSGKLRHPLGFSNVKPGCCLIHSMWR